MSKSTWACTGATRDDCKERRRHSKRILFSSFRSTARMYNIFDHNVYCTKKTFWSQQFLFLHLAAMSKYIYNNIYIYTHIFFTVLLSGRMLGPVRKQACFGYIRIHPAIAGHLVINLYGTGCGNAPCVRKELGVRDC